MRATDADADYSSTRSDSEPDLAADSAPDLVVDFALDSALDDLDLVDADDPIHLCALFRTKKKSHYLNPYMNKENEKKFTVIVSESGDELEAVKHVIVVVVVKLKVVEVLLVH